MRDGEWINGVPSFVRSRGPTSWKTHEGILGGNEPEVFARRDARAGRASRDVSARRPRRRRGPLRSSTAVAPESSPRSSRAPVRWLASAVPPDGSARRGPAAAAAAAGTRAARTTRASNLHLRDVQRAIVDAPDVQTILDLCDPATVARFSSVNVATALSAAKRARRPAAETRGPERAPVSASTRVRGAGTALRSHLADVFAPGVQLRHAPRRAAAPRYARATAQSPAAALSDAPASAAWRALRGAAAVTTMAMRGVETGR